MQLALANWMPAQVKAWLATVAVGVSPAKSKRRSWHSCLYRTALWIRRNRWSRVFVKDVRELCFFETWRHGKLAVSNRVEAYICDVACNFRRMPRRAGIMLAGMVFLTHDHAHPDRQAREIAKIVHFCVRRVPKLRFDRLNLCQDGSAIGIVRRDPIGGLKIGSVIRVLLGVVTIDRFLLASGCKSRFIGARLVAA